MPPRRTLRHAQRVSRVVMYLLIGSAGGLYFLTTPSPSIVYALGPNGSRWWAGFMFLGGVLCAAAVFRMAVLEFVGLPLVITAMGLFGLSLLTLSVTPPRPDNTRFILGLAFLGFACGYYARLRDVADELRIRKAMDKAEAAQSEAGA